MHIAIKSDPPNTNLVPGDLFWANDHTGATRLWVVCTRNRAQAVGDEVSAPDWRVLDNFTPASGTLTIEVG